MLRLSADARCTCAPPGAQVLDVDKTDTQGNVKGESLVRRAATFPACVFTRCRALALMQRATAQGVLECRLSEVVGARGCTIVRPLKNSTNKSVIKVMAEEATAVKGTVVLSLKGVKLANRCVRTMGGGVSSPR